MKDAVNTILQEQDSLEYQFISSREGSAVDVEGYEEWIEQQATLKAVWFPDTSYVDVHAYVQIKWNCDIDLREWGIKSMDPNIVDVSLNVSLILPGSDGTEDTDFELYVESTRAEKWQYEIVDWESKCPVIPRSVSINIKSKKISVYF